jgi:fructose-1,6-bisphosphatase/sedoheptulose 1,7-bisphosphatase-like protein
MGIPSQMDMGMQNLLSSMATSAQNSLLEGCPVFIERLRNNPKLAQRIKELMQNWSNQETSD